MGILNLTPDSFSDGGLHTHPDAALRRFDQMVAEGADAIDLGAESTRPGYVPISVEEEWARLEPVLYAVRRRWEGPISVDTQKPEVARRALEAGADIVNDIWGVAHVESMGRLLAEHGAGYVLMFHREPAYAPGQVNLEEMVATLRQAVAALAAGGVPPAQVLVDPGLGFAYGVEDNWTVLRALSRFTGLGAGLLIGPSRKRFLGALSGRPPEARDVATAAVAALAALAGADVVRVHAVGLAREALAVADRWVRSG
ncbi:MAG: dihydropteroate synthase [Firmicutes bacterium]|nr:dihydropteroate synthase [Alicyclobacillaceae bacterium]MCL6497164.1 dihydropteroate synthase [Bacillota bacterium]